MTNTKRFRHGKWPVGCVAVLVAMTSALAASTDKPALFGNPKLLFDAQHPAFGPPAATLPPPRTQTTVPGSTFNIPSTHIGLQNPTVNDVAAIIDMGGSQSRVVLLKAHQFETIDCRNCPDQVKLIVPRGSTPAAGDFSTTVKPGRIYEFKFDSNEKRWIVAPQ